MVATETAWAYRLVRYAPRPERDEWINCGLLLLSSRENRIEARFLREDAEFARLRRLHPHADIALLRNLEAELTARLAGFEGDVAGHMAKLDDALSNFIQLGPQRALLTDNIAKEFERMYEDYVAPPRAISSGTSPGAESPGAIRKQAGTIFATAGLSQYLQPARAADFTYAGDPMRIDFHYRFNGTQGFAQALVLSRDPAQAKAFAFTAERIRAKLHQAEIFAITEAEPQPQNVRHSFFRSVLEEQRIDILPLPQLEPWARQLAERIR